MKKWLNIALYRVLSTLTATLVFANQSDTEGELTLSYSDGRADITGVKNVNTVLRTAGVNVTTLPLPK